MNTEDGKKGSIGSIIVSNKRWIYLELFARIFLMLVVAIGIFMIINIYFINRSLWLDEAYLAKSITQRTLFNMTSEVLEWNQAAPVLYLYMVKIITMIFGNTEVTLRIFSFITYLGTLILIYLNICKTFKCPSIYGYIGMALISTLSIYMRYANEFKPYMSDGFFVLLAIYLYYIYKENGMSLLKLSIIFSALLWFSNPVCFVVAGILVCEFLNNVFEKNFIHLKVTFISGILILISFTIYYFCWLRLTANSDHMLNYWRGYRFPLIPNSLDDLKKVASLYGGLIGHFKTFKYVYSILIFIGVAVSCGKRCKYTNVILISVFLVLFASYIEKYPIADRLMLFSYPVFIIYTCIALRNFNLVESKISNVIIKVVVVIVLLTSNDAFLKYYKNPYMGGEEANNLIAYVDENINTNEKIYAYYHAIPILGYKNGYNNYIGQKNFGDVNNILFGSHYFASGINEELLDSDVNAMTESQLSYVLISHGNAKRVDPLLNKLRGAGFLELIMLDHSTPLYFFSTALSGVKTRATYELVNYEFVDGVLSIEINVNNVGSTMFGKDEKNKIKLGIRAFDDEEVIFDKRLYECDRNIRQGEGLTIKKSIEIPESISSVDIELVREGKYWFRQLGIEPITINTEYVGI